MRLVMRVGLRDLRCKWLRDVTVPKIFLLRHLSVLTDPLSEAVYWQGLMINPAKTESRATVSQQRASRFQLALFPIHLSRSLSKTTLHTHTQYHRRRAQRCSAQWSCIWPRVTEERRWILSYMIPPAHTRARARVNALRREEGRMKEKVSTSSDLVRGEYVSFKGCPVSCCH